MKSKILISMFFAATVSVAYAAKMDGAPASPCQGLKVATGPAGKGYSKLFADTVKASPGQIALCEVNTEGGLDNLNVLSTKKADVGFVSIDTLKKMAEGDPNIAALQVVATLNSNFLHIVTSSNGYTIQDNRGWYEKAKAKLGSDNGGPKVIRITKLSDLRDAPVALVGSAQLMVRQLDKTMNLNMRFIDVASDDEAWKMVKKGEAFAAFSVAGWPHGGVSKLTQDQGLTLVGFDMPISSPYAVRPFSYKNVGVYNLPAVSVPNLLVTRNFNGAKINDVAAYKRVIEKELPDLKDGDFEPGWNEITSLDAKVDWPVFGGQAVAANSNGGKKK